MAEISKTSVKTLEKKRQEKMLYNRMQAKKWRIFDKQRAAVLAQSV
jgi:hypothetical protein